MDAARSRRRGRHDCRGRHRRRHGYVQPGQRGCGKGCQQPTLVVRPRRLHVCVHDDGCHELFFRRADICEDGRHGSSDLHLRPVRRLRSVRPERPALVVAEALQQHVPERHKYHRASDVQERHLPLRRALRVEFRRRPVSRAGRGRHYGGNLRHRVPRPLLRLVAERILPESPSRFQFRRRTSTRARSGQRRRRPRHERGRVSGHLGGGPCA